MTERRHVEWAGFLMLMCLIVGTITGVARLVPYEEDETRRAIGTLATRLEIERRERKALAARMQALEDRQIEERWYPRSVSARYGRAHP